MHANQLVVESLIRKWHPEEDPLTREQCATLIDILDDTPLSTRAFEGFLMISGRLVDDVGNHRTGELVNVFRTHLPAGRQSLVLSLEDFANSVGGMERFERDFPVSIIPPIPAFPLIRIRRIDLLAHVVYRLLDSTMIVQSSGLPVVEHIVATRRLPFLPYQRVLVQRTKPRMHWCSYQRWTTPRESGSALQIRQAWSDCGVRATITCRSIRGCAFVALNGDTEHPDHKHLGFYGYFLEPLAQDHPELAGGGVQIAVHGAPKVCALERWDESAQCWTQVFSDVP
jgi:hypothetical protein